jgi:hypothetical protein
MDYFKNHCWCSESHWNGKHYDCQIIVTLYAKKEHYEDDYNTLMVEKDYYDKEDADSWAGYMEEVLIENGKEYTQGDLDEYKQRVGTKNIKVLNSDVMDWLKENIPDTKTGKGWCVGSDQYVATDSSSSYSVFFQRRKDAMSFIKRWSKWKKPVHYTQYFTDVRKTLNVETGEYEEL